MHSQHRKQSNPASSQNTANDASTGSVNDTWLLFVLLFVRFSKIVASFERVSLTFPLGNEHERTLREST